MKQEKSKMQEALNEKSRQLSAIELNFTSQIKELNNEKEILQDNLDHFQQEVEDLEEKLKESKEAKPTITTVITETTEIIKSKPKLNNGTYLQVEFENSSESESEESTDQSLIIELQKENQELREQVRNLEKFQENYDRLRLTSSDTQDCDSNSVSSSIIAYSPSMNELRLVDSDRLSTVTSVQAAHKSTIGKVAEMRAQLGLPPIAHHQVASLENENIELTSKLRKTRIMLNDNTNRLRDMYRKLNKSEVLIQNLYMENSRLMRAMKASFSRCASPEAKA
ncbi:unnamed protein product [Oikopleura dioica]|nr:unnamed protein product [Oikopleura dioica]